MNLFVQTAIEKKSQLMSVYTPRVTEILESKAFKGKACMIKKAYEVRIFTPRLSEGILEIFLVCIILMPSKFQNVTNVNPRSLALICHSLFSHFWSLL